jgi:tetratricopeptide (TPR) repeat protein
MAINPKELIRQATVLSTGNKWQDIIALLGSKDLNEYKSAELFYLRGTGSLGLGQYPASMEDFDQALSLDTNLSMAYYHRGLAWQGLGHQENALQDLEKALELNPDLQLDMDFNAAHIDSMTAGIKQENTPVISDAMLDLFGKAFDEARLSVPKGMPHYTVANNWLNKNNFEKALANYTMAIELSPDFAEAYFQRGMAHAQQSSLDKAIEDFTTAISLKTDGGYYFMRGALWLIVKAYPKAIDDLSQAIDLDFADASAYTSRGKAWDGLGEFDRAIEDHNTAIRLDPQSAMAYSNRGESWYFKNRDAEAIADFKMALTLQPEEGRPYFLLGRLYQRREEFGVSCAYFKRAFFLGIRDGAMVQVFKDVYPCPYILKTIYSGLPSFGELIKYMDGIHQVSTVCRSWDTYIAYLTLQNLDQTNPGQYYSLLAIVNYYMGNSIESFRIFDEMMDNGETPYQLTLKDQYYFVMAAIDFLQMEEERGIMTFAMQQVLEQGEKDELSSYYAGQICCLNNELDMALNYFMKSPDYIPSLYARMAIYKKRDQPMELRATAQKIKDLESTGITGFSFLHGIRPIPVADGASIANEFSLITERLFYFELIQEISETRDLLGIQFPFSSLEFSRLLTLETLFYEEMAMIPRIEHLKLLQRESARQLESIAGQYDAVELKKAFYKQKLVSAEFSLLQTQIKEKPSDQSIEEILAMSINTPSIPYTWYYKFILYFFLDHAFDSETALSLYLFTLTKNLFSPSTKEDKAELFIAEKILELIKLPVGQVYKLVAAGLTVFHLGLEKEIVEDETLEYKTFKKDLLQNLGFLEEKLSIHILSHFHPTGIISIPSIVPPL